MKPYIKKSDLSCKNVDHYKIEKNLIFLSYYKNE